MRKRQTQVTFRRSVIEGAVANLERTRRVLSELPAWGSEVLRTESTANAVSDLTLVIDALLRGLPVRH